MATPVQPRSTVDALERRTLRAAVPGDGPTFYVDDNQALHVIGTAGNDHVDVRTTDAGTVLRLNEDGSRRKRFSPDAIKSVFFDGGSGHDEVTLNAATHLATSTRRVERRRVIFTDGKTVDDFSTEAEPGTDLFNTPAAGPAHWLKRYARQQKNLRGTTAKTLFIGDSLMERFQTQGETEWKALKRDYDASDLGFSGDTTSSLMYRLHHDLLDGLWPREIFVSIGTNNVALTDDADSTVRGVNAVLETIHAERPQAKLVLSSILPRGLSGNDAEVDAVNAGLKRVARRFDATYSDATDEFAPMKIRNTVFDANSVHLTQAGYARWMPVIRAGLQRAADKAAQGSDSI